jgi:predicted ATPase
MLDEEFQAPPLTETQALARTIRAEYEGLPDRPLRQKPFVGRRYERALLLQHAEQAQEGRGGFVLVEGEAGLGKTRLIETLAEGAAWRKIGVAWGRARELARQAPYAPLVEALHAALAGPRATMVAERLHPSVVATITGLLPELAGEQGSGKSLSVGGAINAGAELPPMRENDGQRFNLTAALADLLEALSAIVPSVIILDDVQWADPGLWEAMRALVPRIASWRLLVVLSYRATELRTDLAAWQTLCDLDSALAPPRVSLRGLTPDDCADLARRLGAHIEHSTITALHRQTDGNPLFVQELLAAKDDPRATATLHSVLERRLAQLDALARAALEAGAVLGRAFTYPVWRSVVGSDVLAALPAIEAGRFLEENEDGYIFQHDVMREYVYHAIAPERRRTLHRRAATVLSAATAEPSTLAWHYTQAEDWAEAVRAHREAGDAAARIYAYNPALGHYSQALELLASGWQ